MELSVAIDPLKSRVSGVCQTTPPPYIIYILVSQNPSPFCLVQLTRNYQRVWKVSGGHLEGFWNVSGGCLKGVCMARGCTEGVCVQEGDCRGIRDKMCEKV